MRETLALSFGGRRSAVGGRLYQEMETEVNEAQRFCSALPA